MSHLGLHTSLEQPSSAREYAPEGSFEPLMAGLSQILNGEHDIVARRIISRDLPTDPFSRFIDRHRLQSVVLSQVQGSPLLALLPGEWLQQLKAFSLNQWARQETLVRELARVSDLLAASGHDFILLKGPYLAARFYGAIDRREFWDLDILVKREQVAAVELLLCAAGYARKSQVLFSTDITSRFTHAFDFAKGGFSVDLHWLLSANATHYLDYEAIWRQRQTFVLRNADFSVLSDEYEVVFNLISTFKDLERGMARLKSFVDLYFILSAVSRRLDWDEFLKHRRREKILRISVNVLAFFFDLFDCRHRFPDVAAALAHERGQVKILPSEDRQALIDGSPGALRNRGWASGIYECSRLHVFLWWLLSLPFRLAVHDSGRYARFKARLQQAKARLSRAKFAHERRRGRQRT